MGTAAIVLTDGVANADNFTAVTPKVVDFRTFTADTQCNRMGPRFPRMSFE